MLLAIDTSSRYAGVALLDSDGRLVQSLHWRSNRNHTVELLPAIEMLLNRENAKLGDLKGIAVALGPGSFSALRVGLSVAKGLAWANGLPLVTATTLEAEAFAYRNCGAPACAVLGVGRGEVAWAMFEAWEGQLLQTCGERIASIDELVASLPMPALVCGEALEQHGQALSGAVPKGVRLALPHLPGQRALALAYLGYSRLQSGLVQDPATVQPLYLRRPTISEPRWRPTSPSADTA